MVMNIVIDNLRLKWLKPDSYLLYYRISWLGFDQLCWHNFVIGTNFGGISIEHNASIIDSDLPV